MIQQRPHSRATEPVRAALYARVSSDQQAEQHTIDSQVTDLVTRATADGHEISEGFRFLDNGYSGANLIRPALERLRDLVALAAIDVVYVHAPDASELWRKLGDDEERKVA